MVHLHTLSNPRSAWLATFKTAGGSRPHKSGNCSRNNWHAATIIASVMGSPFNRPARSAQGIPITYIYSSSNIWSSPLVLQELLTWQALVQLTPAGKHLHLLVLHPALHVQRVVLGTSWTTNLAKDSLDDDRNAGLSDHPWLLGSLLTWHWVRTAPKEPLPASLIF